MTSSLFRALRHRTFALLWTGQTLSRVGDFMYEIALAWWVLQKTGSPELMSVVLICSFTPMILLSLFGGVLVDRWHRTRLMLSSDVVRRHRLPGRRAGLRRPPGGLAHFRRQSDLRHR